ncbi:class I SAM-dependent methyltransferase [Chryseobacterium joostei]|uniref:Class I SAM-dependent methyltransferase n=1 Tax=Chryseobacterium joostei TaxID=112234 RepID=A0A1N7HUZ1_9FLAO|nr:class I SAM-dependent methyltransferase [Chryseobacterium joostei]AZA99022.1 class I SAM-dependent methyltransferase [Chryseobacterium joostei]SIS28632.1 Methyltransferase domain-containing protein [Chryseobacterium joostei]
MTDNTWLNRWDKRYGSEQFAYGTDPNHYLKEQLNKLSPGRILFPAEGEGRNAVFAATKGWNVSAFDISANGQKKAFQLAEQNHVNIDYQVGELSTLNYQKEQFDVIALIYAHFPASVKSSIHQMLNQYLRKGGFIIFEAFSKNHLEYIAKDEKVGGPKDIESLFSIDEIKADFPDYNIVELTETKIDLNEGLFHNGTGSVIRFVGQKM